VLGSGNTLAANPDKIKVGILLPLTGTFGAVAETQRDGALLAVDVVNKRGGLKMPWGKVKVEGIVADDEAKLDVGVWRYRYMVSEGVKGVGGQTWAPLAFAINALVKKDPMPYFPVCVMAKEAFEKGKLAECTFATAYSPWTVGYMDGSAAVKVLGKKRIFFLARADSWGWDIRDGVYAAAKENGAEIVGYDEVSLGTSDYTTILQKVRGAKPDVFISAQFGGDAVALLKQCHQMGLNKEMTIFNAFITNVVAKGIPPQALEGVYSMHYFYYRQPGLVFFRAHRKSSLLSLFLGTCKRYRQEQKIIESLETFELQDVSGRQVKHLSLGEKRRLEIAMAILAEPRVLLLDEPLAGLGESEIKGVLGVLGKHVGRQTILIMEHKISKVENFLERLTVMHEGKIIADGRCEECLRDPEVRRSYWQIDVPAEGAEPADQDGVRARG
jgi:ABC-type branched-subunit amino acid transport system substrate-binding protein